MTRSLSIDGAERANSGMGRLAALAGMGYASAMLPKLHTPVKPPGLRTVLVRMLFVSGLILFATTVVYLEGGLRDSRTGTHPGFFDCFYFTIVTVSTVGYGDIVPVRTVSRLTDALVLTPIRFSIIFAVFGTIYQVARQRIQEIAMNRTVHALNQHVIVAGYGATGRAVVRELLLQGAPPNQVVVIDADTARLDEAAAQDVICVKGDATREQTLQSVAVERAAHIVVCPGRDDTAVLITLTARDLNPRAQVVAMCHEPENVKQLRRGGAHHIVNPSVAGGALMAAATRQAHLVDTLTDILSVGGAMKLDERPVTPQEVGRKPRDLDDVVVRVYRAGEAYGVDQAPALEAGDVIVFVSYPEALKNETTSPTPVD